MITMTTCIWLLCYPIGIYHTRADCLAERSEKVWTAIYTGEEVPVLKCSGQYICKSCVGFNKQSNWKKK